MAHPAKNLYNPAIMKSPLSISHPFSRRLLEGLSPALETVCSYPSTSRGITRAIRPGDWVLEYHTKDSGTIRLQDDTAGSRERAAGTIHIYAPESVFWEDLRTADTPLQVQYLKIRWQGECPLAAFVDPKLHYGRILAGESRVGDLMHAAAETCNEAGDAGLWKAQGILMELIHLLLQAKRRPDGEWELVKPEGVESESFNERVTRYLRQNIGQRLCTTDIADHMKVSESTLNHKFKAETGCSPIARFGEIKIEFVKGLLLKGERLKVIANMMGYYDEFYLSKSFKKATGMSPRQFVAERSITR
jgi:AraC-like DNA-binding protein